MNGYSGQFYLIQALMDSTFLLPSLLHILSVIHNLSLLTGVLWNPLISVALFRWVSYGQRLLSLCWLNKIHLTS